MVEPLLTTINVIFQPEDQLQNHHMVYINCTGTESFHLNEMQRGSATGQAKQVTEKYYNSNHKQQYRICLRRTTR